MVINNYHAHILYLGEVKDSNGFKKCHITIETKAKADDTGDTVYQAEVFECVAQLGKDDKATKAYEELKALAPLPAGPGQPVQGKDYEVPYFPATFLLRSFIYKEKGIDKRGKELQLKRWAR